MTCAIIIPAYNAAAYIREALDSALAQSRAASSVVVADDGSTDETGTICESYGDAVMLVRQPNRGVSVARATGAEAVRADWLLFLDADDRLVSDALEKMLQRAGEQSACGVVYGQTVYFDNASGARRIHGKADSEGPPPAGTLGSFWKSAITTPGAAIIRADLFREVGGFNPAVNSLADRDFWLKAGVLSEFRFVPSPVLEKREHGANMSGNLDRALFQAAFVQLGFLDWCAARRIDTSFLNTTPAAIIDNVLGKGLETRSLDGVGQIVALADERGIQSALLPKARRYAALPRRSAEFRLRLRSGLRRLTRLFAS